MSRRKRKTNPINRGFKERTIVATLEQYLEPNYSIINNQKIAGGSSKYRPDILINCDGYNIIVEIDERQHRSYKENEQRTIDLINDLNGLPLVLIRFNPDRYTSNRKTYKSLFSKTRGERIYQIGCPKKYEERMSVLMQILMHYLSNAPEESYVEHKLFFNRFDINSYRYLLQPQDTS